jgi:hypothetical protein
MIARDGNQRCDKHASPTDCGWKGINPIFRQYIRVAARREEPFACAAGHAASHRRPHPSENAMKNRKLRLDLDQLAVESFAVAGADAARGTVHAHGPFPPAEPASDYNGECQTYAVSCNGSCGSCVNSCWATCQATCNSCVYSCALSCHSVCYEPA